MDTQALLIPGAPAAAGTTTITAPFDGAELATLETGSAAHSNHALSTAYGLYRDRSAWIPIHERVAILDRAANIMEGRKDELVRQAAAEGGKPWRDSAVEVDRAIDGVRICIEVIRSEQGEVVPMGTTASSANRAAFTLREPIGVVVAVSAFNHPLNLIVHQVGAAVAAGCPVIVKPAEDTPLSCIAFAKILHEAGLPAEWCQVLIADDHTAAEALVTDERVGFFSFIGSARVGWMLRSKLAPGTRCALEHGGVAPLVLAEDADLDLALPAVTKGGFYHSGQVCVSVQRVFAHSSIAKSFAQSLAAEAQQLTVGDPLDEKTDLGPLIRHAETDRVHEWVSEAVDAGATLLCGGKKISDSCYEPTVFLNPPADAKVSTDEIFGPVVCVYSYDDMDDAIAQANSLPVSFQAAVFTGSLDIAMDVYKKLDASAVMVNDHTAFRVDGMPFAGLRESGLGVGGIPHTIADMSIEKMLVIKSPAL
ncbi:MAG: aldehyde dehydrogenase family protein [Gammaproteobacteria bacterium]|nr:aldehyde dehydrogenase family protein [Gammaproteobacteria bacterium]NND54320.1 aldehyde dehydrogenase family protein [Gammaproteobacteria bacterium]